MFKRIMLSLTFLATFGLVGVGMTDTSEARRYWRSGPAVSYYYGPPVYYRSYRPFYYGPRYYYGAPRHYGYYGPPRGGVYFSLGF